MTLAAQSRCGRYAALSISGPRLERLSFDWAYVHVPSVLRVSGNGRMVDGLVDTRASTPRAAARVRADRQAANGSTRSTSSGWSHRVPIDRLLDGKFVRSSTDAELKSLDAAAAPIPIARDIWCARA